jgi:nucleoside triphosphate diphosphatase
VEKEKAERYSLADLLAIMARLRDPESGCPWDVQQSFETIAPYTIEEAYEVADAIQRGDPEALKDELGDLLLQVVYHAQMATEDARFGFDDVVDAVAAKMVRRHPHVFEDPTLRDSFIGSGRWEAIKAAEKAGSGRERAGASILDEVAVALPALSRAVKLQKRAARVGFDWPDAAPVVAKMAEELGELKSALGTGDAAHAAEEFGDLLFVMANLGRHLKLDPEAALRAANAKFERRFKAIERALAAEGRKPDDATLEEMDMLWERAKADENRAGRKPRR